MFLAYQQVPVVGVVQSIVNLVPYPTNATQVELQADGGPIRFTMDGVSVPTATFGMVLLVGMPPAQYLIEDFIRMKFTASALQPANLNIHYFAGRNI